MLRNDIKVSIIVPIYNVEKYLSKCIESIFSQTHSNLEIILVDDGSTDNSGKIADEYKKKDKRIIVIHKENEKVSVARNVGIDTSTGEFVCFSDADDYLMPDYVEYLLDLAVENHADIAVTMNMFTTYYTNQVDRDEIRIRTSEQGTIDILTYNMPIGVYCKIFKRSFLGNQIRFIPHLYIGEGFNFNTLAFQRANKVVEGNRKVYFYRRDNPTSATTEFKIEKWQNAIIAIENIYDDLIINSDSIEKAWDYAYWHTHCDAFNFLVMAKDEKKYLNKYKKWKKMAQKKAVCAFKVDIILREKLRAIIIMICPRFMPWIIKQRNKYIHKSKQEFDM